MIVTDRRHALTGTLALLAATVAAVFAIALAVDRDRPVPALAEVAPEESPGSEPATQLDPDALLELGVEQTPLVSRRVARIRELDFDQVPKPQISDTDRLRAVAERELSRQNVQRRLVAADIELKLLGLLEPEQSLGDVASDVTAAAAAYYDPREGELFLVGDAVPAGAALTEFVLAHELTHALEDQAYGLPRSNGVSDDGTLAETALVEGTATALMMRYSQLHLNPFELAAEAGSLDAGSSGELPRFAEAEVTFTYLAGQRFVDELLRVGGDWKLVDFAYQRRLPATTEQILHPEKYLADEGPLEVAGLPTPGPGWKELDSGDLGEFATREILREDAEAVGADAAAAGWGGDRYRLYGLAGAGAGCTDDCRESYAMAIAWRGDDRGEARELATGVRGFAERALGGEASDGSAGESTFELDGGWAAVTLDGDRVGLGFAPTEELAVKLAEPVG